MGKDYVGARMYLFATKRIVEINQHWDGKLYPWTLGINSRIKGQIGNTSQIT